MEHQSSKLATMKSCIFVVVGGEGHIKVSPSYI